MKIFSDKLIKLAQGASTREIDFSAIPYKERLQILAEDGYVFNESKDYPVPVKISLVNADGYRLGRREFSVALDKVLKKSCDPRNDARIADEMYDKFLDGLYDEFNEVEMTVTVNGASMTETQKVGALCHECGIKMDSKISREVFAGENVLETLRWVRGLSDAEFTKMFRNE